MRASAAARPTPVPAPVTIAILGVVMRFLRLRVGLRFRSRSDGAPAYNDAGADTARLDDSVEPAPSQACICQAATFVRRTSQVLGRVQPRPGRSEKNKGSTKNIHLVSTLIMHSALKRNNFRRR